eukprot:TRINITY_DN33266_c0_g1_i1.p1 TRINITY_DN33266_c0_g1~~TRINITY_DN33266_c0_g1_i1.p1  ORF type:complete len:325 (+),score=46.49 TRINITY_DN33266_c0_g1_i1:123-1097(+)
MSEWSPEMPKVEIMKAMQILQIALGLAFAIIGLPASPAVLTYGFRLVAVLHSLAPFLTLVSSSKFHSELVDSLQPLTFAFVSIELFLLGLVWQAEPFGFITLVVTSLIFHGICVDLMPLSNTAKLIFVMAMVVGAPCGLLICRAISHRLLLQPSARDEICYRILPMISLSVLTLFMIFGVGTKINDEDAMRAAALKLVDMQIKKEEAAARQSPEEETKRLLDELQSISAETQNDPRVSQSITNLRVFSPYASQESICALQASSTAVRWRRDGQACLETQIIGASSFASNSTHTSVVCSLPSSCPSICRYDHPLLAVAEDSTCTW